MSTINDILKSLPHKTYIETYIGSVDVKRTDGKTLNNVPLFRKEELADMEDIESACGYEYVVIVQNEMTDEEIFIGDNNGYNILVEENEL